MPRSPLIIGGCNDSVDRTHEPPSRRGGGHSTREFPPVYVRNSLREIGFRERPIGTSVNAPSTEVRPIFLDTVSGQRVASVNSNNPPPAIYVCGATSQSGSRNRDRNYLTDSSRRSTELRRAPSFDMCSEMRGATMRMKKEEETRRRGARKDG